MIRALSNSLGVHIDDPTTLRAMVLEFYKTLYTSEGVNGMHEVLRHVPRRVMPAMNQTLCAPYVGERSRNSKFSMHHQDQSMERLV